MEMAEMEEKATEAVDVNKKVKMFEQLEQQDPPVVLRARPANATSRRANSTNTHDYQT